MRYKSTVRYELKYLIDWQQRDALCQGLAGQMTPDLHGDSDGKYAITSLYYDTSERRAYWDKLEGVRLRRKVRVRTYGESAVRPDTSVFLEVKERDNKTLSKRRVQLPYADATDFEGLAGFQGEELVESLSGKILDEANNGDRAANISGAASSGHAVCREVDYLYRMLQLQPSCIVAYNRLAFNGNEPHTDLRVTFDTELRGRTHDLSLLSTGYADMVYFLPPTHCVMEIKANHTVPYWLAQLVNTHHGSMRRISKYCLALQTCGVIEERQRIIV